MTSEVCPFCGRTFKRLKTHLPHCKAASTSKKPSPDHDITAKQACGRPAAAPDTPAMMKKKKKKRKEEPPSPETGLESTGALAKPTSPSSSLTSTSLPKSAKKKLKPSDHIKTAVSSAPPPRSVSAARSKTHKQNLHASTETEMVSEGSSSSGLLKSTTTASPSTVARQGKNSVEERTLPSTIHKVKSASKKKVSESSTRTRPSPSAPNAEDNPHSQRASSRGHFWVDTDEETHAWKSEHLGSRITLQDVRTTLERAKSSRLSVPSRAETSPVLYLMTSSGQVFSRSQNAGAGSGTQPSSTDVPQQELPTVPRGTTQVSPTPLKEDGSLLSKAASAVGAASSKPPTSQLSHSSTDAGLKVAQHLTGLSSIPPSPANLPAPQLPPHAESAETASVSDGSVMKRLQFDPRKGNTGGVGAAGGLAQRRLGQVRLRELPEWLACKTPSQPRDVVDWMQRGWLWYYRKYVDVKKGGVGGVGMLVAGYCVLSYIWTYPHIKHDRWRKYH